MSIRAGSGGSDGVICFVTKEAGHLHGVETYLLIAEKGLYGEDN